MTNAASKAQSIPLFNMTTMASTMSSLSRHRDFISPEMAKAIDGIVIHPELADASIEIVEMSLLILAIFNMSLDRQQPVQVLMPRETWEYLKLNKPAAVDSEAHIREVFCIDPLAVTIEFRPINL
ncbi:hypothetical protein ACJU26_08280 [Acidithiobacillus sp. M4-SHS-6]|uniref:hypothetical protein n=1 Tax=Acidithiobacillus sp. M4-SHS-6 TaxID=3383024 RepID=UPI0039BEB736